MLVQNQVAVEVTRIIRFTSFGRRLTAPASEAEKSPRLSLPRSLGTPSLRDQSVGGSVLPERLLLTAGGICVSAPQVPLLPSPGDLKECGGHWAAHRGICFLMARGRGLCLQGRWDLAASGEGSSVVAWGGSRMGHRAWLLWLLGRGPACVRGGISALVPPRSFHTPGWPSVAQSPHLSEQHSQVLGPAKPGSNSFTVHPRGHSSALWGPGIGGVSAKCRRLAGMAWIGTGVQPEHRPQERG